MKPDFLIIGAMKCGTSTLCAYLEDHPGAFMVPGAEPRFFSHDENFARGTDWYEGLFADAQPGQPKGEGTNSYANGARFPDAAARMAAYNPALKLIYITRHPVNRITSAWVQNRIDMGDLISPSIDDAVRAEPDRYLDQSLYWKNLSRYREHFPDSQIHIIFMEDLKTDPQSVMRGLCGFLGIDPEFEAARPHQNKGDSKRVPSEGWSRLKKLPGLEALAGRVLPAEARMALRDRFFSRSARDVSDLSTATRAELVDALREDSAAFLAHAGKPTDFWKL
ncbi:MAG: sulfotransferase domain-containing protein [Pseudomonadota bacterium]